MTRWLGYWLGFVLLVVALVVGGIGWARRVSQAPTAPDEPQRAWTVGDYGTFGDAVAPVTAAATILTFALGIAGLLLQRRDVHEESTAQERLTARQEELVAAEKATAAAMQTSVRTMQEQLTTLAQALDGQKLSQRAMLDEQMLATRAHARAAAAMEAMAEAMRSTAALQLYQTRRSFLVETRDSLADLEDGMERTIRGWEEVTSRMAKGEAADAPVAAFRAGPLSRLREMVVSLGKLVAAHDYAAPGTEQDQTEAIRDARDGAAKIAEEMLALTGEVHKVMGPLMPRPKD